jgi:hypothetical protein
VSTGSIDDTTFKEYTPLGPKRKTRQHYFVLVVHIVAAIAISLNQLSIGLGTWFLGFGILTPILLILQGTLYPYSENDAWYKEEMIPFISRLTLTTESETDRLRQYHRRSAWSMLIIGYFDILLCQSIWTYGLTVIMPNFIGDDFLTRLVAEGVAFAVLFGPFFLYLVILFPIAFVVGAVYESRYRDIAHLIDIENECNREDSRRAEEKKAMRKGKASSDIQSITSRSE